MQTSLQPTVCPACAAHRAGRAQLIALVRVLSDTGLPRLLGVGAANAQGLPPNAPAGPARGVVNELHAELATLSTQGRHHVVPGAGHGSILQDQAHAAVVIDAVRDAIAAARERTPSP